MEDEPRLEYAPRPPMHRRPGFRRLVLWLVITAGVGSAWFWWGPVSYRFQLYYWQQKCLSYTAPPGQVVFDMAAAGKEPVAMAREWDQFYRLLSPPGQKSMATAFLHERRSPNGKRWLVAVHVQGVPAIYVGGTVVRTWLLWHVDVVEPGQGLRLPRLTWTRSLPEDYAQSGDPMRAQVQAGQPDERDPSHFVITLRSPDHPLVFDGWIDNDGRVAIEPRPESVP